MKDIQYLCESIGISEEAFEFNKMDGKLYLTSKYLMAREYDHYKLNNEREIIREAVHLYRNGIAQLLTELFMIEGFYRSFYGDDLDEDIIIEGIEPD